MSRDIKQYFSLKSFLLAVQPFSSKSLTSFCSQTLIYLLLLSVSNMQRKNVVHHRDYTKIPQDEGKVETDNIEDLRFQTKPQSIPWATICFVVFFFMGGTVITFSTFTILIKASTSFHDHSR